MHQPEAGLSINVYSDVVCPWCYIGKRRLEQALEAAKGRDATTVIWRPFQLNPTMPKAGMDRRVYLETKFGGPGELKAIQDRVAAVGMSAGIDFHAGIAIGKFHGVIRPHTPSGSRTAMLNLLGSSDGVVTPCRRRPSPAMR